ncbi:CCA tRNA nucleotidyltransferase [Nodosilinea sp. E11]|uniref:CCA tRNA nucleotidyltransferase n=1 Tax=Nodosilinea sp. E11 TaxID=3037479 RepID=UPI002934C00E|nr:CCA tRNA nucleotidyltransferase [Nodosilinea sp. E11]WOD41233.1 CCA tRNA nucleotidyltransferase [Nodosilinea sp. E11]
MATEKSALSPKTWPFSVSLLPQQAYLVGGSVRDALLRRQADYLDLDFVLPERAIATAQSIAKHCGAGFVVLDAEHQIARVVFANATVDFAQQVGPTIYSDLHRRDFTINAIAYSPHSETLLDPLDGCADLDRKVLCMVAAENLEDDPLRLLRAYRQAAQLGFSLDDCTQQTIRTLAPNLGRMAAERVRGELDCLLSLPEGSVLLSLAWQDGLLQSWLPEIAGPELDRLATIDQLAAQYHERWPDYSHLLHSWIKEQTTPGLHRSWLKATKLSQLVPAELSAAEATLVRLKYSRAEQQAVLSILKGWEYLCQHPQAGPLPRGEQYQLFKVAGAGFGGVALLALAHGLPESLILPLVERYLTPDDPIAHPQPLLTGKDLVQGLALKPGPQIGELLEGIALAQAEGLVSSREAALNWVKQQI